MAKIIVALMFILVILAGCTVNSRETVDAKLFLEDVNVGPDGKIKISIATVDVLKDVKNIPEKLILRDPSGTEYHYDFSIKKEKIVK